MDTSILIPNIILSMRQYQKENGIVKQCVTNSQYIYDTIKANTHSSVKVRAMMVLSFDKETDTCIMVGGHLVVVLDEIPDDITIIESSYDIFSLKEPSYFDNVKDLMEYCYDNTNDKNNEIKEFLKLGIVKFLSFLKIAEEINNGKFIITNKDFYNKQADYIDKLFS